MTDHRRLVFATYAVALAIVVGAALRAGTWFDGDGDDAPPGPQVDSAANAEPAAGQAPGPAEATPDTPSGLPALIDRDPDLDVPEGLPTWRDLERGNATLRLRVRNDLDGTPVDAPFRLWRLGVPAAGDWSAGDEMRSTEMTVSAEGAVFPALPAGRYRLHFTDLRKGAADPRELRIQDGTNDVDLAAATPRMLRLRLRFVDESGVPILAAGRVSGSSASGGSSGFQVPRWAQPRQRPGLPYVEGPSGRRYGCSNGGGPSTPVQADADGWFDLGSGREDSEHWHDHWSLGFRTDGCATVYGGLWGDVSDHTSFVGVAPRLTTLLGTVRTPDGARADPATAVVSANCRATRCAWDAPSDAWRTATVNVTVKCTGFAPLKFTWSPATADVEHVLVPLPK